MMELASFDYTKFENLSPADLVGYAEQFVNDPRRSISDDDIQRMYSRLNTYDEYRLVYALELGTVREPGVFVKALPRLLSHNKQSVRLAASRKLLHLPVVYITAELLEEVGRNLTGCPEDLSYLMENLRAKCPACSKK